MIKLVVDEKNNHKKIVTLLLDHFNGLTSSLIYKTLRKKDIKVNHKRIKENLIVSEGDLIEVFIADEYLDPPIKLDIIFEDENILMINKPKGIEVLTTNPNSSLTSFVQEYYPSIPSFPYPCHRLDRNTSGLVLFAKNPTALSILRDKFRLHEIDKIYTCTVVGILEKKQAILEDYLFKDRKKSMVYIRSTPKVGYRKIITSYQVLKEDIQNHLSVLEVKLHTGRTHQIRAHLAYIGHPILGDRKIWRSHHQSKIQ